MSTLVRHASLRQQLALAWLACLALGCSSISVSTDYDQNVDFSRYRSWAFAPEAESPKPDLDDSVSALALARIRVVLEQELTVRGYHLAEPGAASFLVTYGAVVRKKFDTRPRTTTVGTAFGSSTMVTGSDVYTYEEGTLVVDILDARSRKMVWAGTARGAVDQDASPAEREERIRDAVRKILDRFPPE